MRKNAAIGLRAHSGWAALVAVAGTFEAPELLARRRIELVDPASRGSKQPYHAAEGQELLKAEEIVGRCAGEARRLAGAALDDILAELGKGGHRVLACGLLLASGRPLPGLEAILASHALIHTADGELFRNALKAAAGQRALSVTGIREKEILSLASTAFGASEDRIAGRLKEIGRSAGTPWTQDQKLAALAAWISLRETSLASRR